MIVFVSVEKKLKVTEILILNVYKYQLVFIFLLILFAFKRPIK